MHNRFSKINIKEKNNLAKLPLKELTFVLSIYV